MARTTSLHLIELVPFLSFIRYIALQKVFQDKAVVDADVVTGRVRALLEGAGRAPDAISGEYVKNFCKNAFYVQVGYLEPLLLKFTFGVYVE